MTSRRSEHPQPARLVLRVGVTGHRAEKLRELGVEQDSLREAVRYVLVRVGEIAHAIRKEPSAVYSHEEPLLRLVSSLAEGADRLAAEEALALGYELQCPLPFSRAEYEKDFKRAESKREFFHLLDQASMVLELDGDPEKRPESYLAAGQILLVNCDLLLAVWDGAPAEGEGGTGQVVEKSLQLEIPTVRIDARPPHEACLWLPKTRPGEHSKWVELKDHLNQRLRATFLLPLPVKPLRPLPVKPPAAHPPGWIRFFLPPPTVDLKRVQRFFEEKPPIWNWGLPFLFFRHLLSGRWQKLKNLHRRLADFQAAGYRDRDSVWKQFSSRAAIERGYLGHFDWVDNLAESYAGRYRSSFLLAYLMGACAVLFAFVGIASANEELSRLWFSIELALILIILTITILGRRHCWHERWMDYRLLAEALRPMEFLALIGRVPPSFKVPAYLKPSDPRRSWSNWHFRAIVRQVGLVGGQIDRKYLVDYKTVLLEAIEDQVKYHQESHGSFERLHHRPHLTAQFLFGLAALGCFFHVAKNWHDPYKTALSFCAIVLPAVGAAFGAILHHGEFERVAMRSQAIGARLEELLEEAKKAEPDLGQLGHIAEEFADLTMSELVDWRFVFLDKNLVLPA